MEAMDQQVLQCLQATLSPDAAIRAGAEGQLDQLFHHSEGGLSLIRILLSDNVDMPQRLIKKFEYPATPLEVKFKIRSLALLGLRSSQKQIRTVCAAVCSSLAKYDYPDEWPTLLEDLVGLCQSSDPGSIHGAVAVIEELSQTSLTEDQINPFVQHLFPVLLAILQNPHQHSPDTRASIVYVFKEVINALETLKDEYPQAVREALNAIGQPWIGTFKQILAGDIEAESKTDWSYFYLYDQVFTACDLVADKFPKLISKDLPEIINQAVRILRIYYPLFLTHHITTDDDAPEPPSPTSDTGLGGTKSWTDLPNSVFDFWYNTAHNVTARNHLKSKEGQQLLPEMVGQIFDYAQVSSADEDDWSSEENLYATSLDDDEYIGDLRGTALDLLMSLLAKHQSAMIKTLQQCLQDRLTLSSRMKSEGRSDWWKPTQATISLIGSIAEDIQGEDGGPALDISNLFGSIVPDLLRQNDAPFLQGRALVAASQFGEVLSAEMKVQYLAAAVQAMESDNMVVKLSAIKAVLNFCRFVKPEDMQPHNGKILTILLSLLPNTNGDTLYLVLDTIKAVVYLNKAVLDEATALHLVDALFAQWLKLSDDTIFSAIIDEVLQDFAGLPVIGAVVRHMGPRIAAVISQFDSKNTIHMPVEAIQFATALLYRQGPIEPEFVPTMTAAVLKRLQSTDDNDVVQHGVIHLTLVVRKDCDKLLQWHDPQGHNGIAVIFSLLGQFLAPTFSESGGIFVGELVMHLFRKAGSSIGPVLPDILKALTTRLATAKMSSFIQSLVMPFAYLFGTEHTQATMELLSGMSVPSPDGQGQVSALALVLESWCRVSEEIIGSWNIRVSSLGMSKLFAMNDERLRRVMVRGDMIISEANANTIMTRSKTKITPNEYTSIPFPLKAFKLILNDVSVVGGGAKRASKEDIANIAEDDGDEDWDDDDPLIGGKDDDEKDEFEYLSSWLADDRPADAQDDDDDLKDDPLAQLDMGAHLTSVLRQNYASDANGMHEMIQGLNEKERGILRGVLVV